MRDEWGALAAEHRNVFATPEWCETWLDHIGAGLAVEPRFFAAPGVIVPLVLVRGRYVTKARFLGFGPANQLGPLGVGGAAALRSALDATRREWGLFLGENLPGTGWADRVPGTLLRREENRTVRGGWASWDEYLASLSAKFRAQLRRDERRLAAEGLAYRTVSALDELDPALDVLFALHRARWGDEASIWFAGQEPFHRAFAHRAFERGWARLYLLELEGRSVAAYYGLRFAGIEQTYQYGREPARKTAAGLVLVAHAMRTAFAEGVTAFEFGPGAQDYKRRFAPDVDTGLETVAVASGLRGRAALLAARRRP